MVKQPAAIIFRISSEQHTKLSIKVPKRGERSAIMRELLRMYLDGKISVQLPRRTILT